MVQFDQKCCWRLLLRTFNSLFRSSSSITVIIIINKIQTSLQKLLRRLNVSLTMPSSRHSTIGELDPLDLRLLVYITKYNFDQELVGLDYKIQTSPEIVGLDYKIQTAKYKIQLYITKYKMKNNILTRIHPIVLGLLWYK